MTFGKYEFYGRQNRAAWADCSGFESDGVKIAPVVQWCSGAVVSGLCGCCDQETQVEAPRKTPSSRFHLPVAPPPPALPSPPARLQRGVINAAAAALCLLHHRSLTLHCP